MSIHLSDSVVEGLPPEAYLLREVSVRLIEPSEQARFDELLCQEHYLKNATVGGLSSQAARSLAALVGPPSGATAPSACAEPTLPGVGRAGPLAQSGLACF